MLSPQAGQRRGHVMVVIALQVQRSGGQAGEPTSDLGFKGLSQGTVPPCQPRPGGEQLCPQQQGR